MEFPHVRSIQEFKEIDKDQGIERNYLYYKKSSTHIHTEKQEVDLFDSPVWGKMLFIDGTLQSTTCDELMYHSALVHPLMSLLKSMNSILILGGGEGATAREVLRWPIERLTMVDYDKELVEHMKIYGAEWSMGAFDDPRLTVEYADAWEFLDSNKSYDGVIIDLTDPDLKTQRWKSLLRKIMKSIQASRGSFVMNAGLYMPWKMENIKELYLIVENLCSTFFSHRCELYTLYIPSFHGEWAFIIVYPKEKTLLKPDSLHMIPDWIRRSIHILDSDLLFTPISTIPSLSKISI